MNTNFEAQIVKKFKIPNQDIKIAIIGLGYVGLPLAVAFGTKYKTIGYDINSLRIKELKNKNDYTQQQTTHQLQQASLLEYTDNINDIKSADIYIIAVPTPVDIYKQPNLYHLLTSTSFIGKILKKDDIVIYESTVYPGCTEEDCIPILEQESGLIYNQDFFCGYSPERINPGDSSRPITSIKKVTSGSTPEVADYIDKLYQSIITAGTFKASSIRVAEASKAIENAQRDVNISFMNELALLFDKLNIDTHEVLEAAATKWNFLNFKPGLVGGHCIGVDPYYLLHKAESVGYHPQVLLSGRRINDQMGVYIANKVVKLMIRKGHKIDESRVLILGITYKENCPDTRNSKVIDVMQELQEFGLQVDIWDPVASQAKVSLELGINLIPEPIHTYEAVILAVAHTPFLTMNWKKISNADTIIYDVKSVLDKSMVSGRL
ncbi:nucleotide sugar dehydrogenase [Siphonobacter sp. SORGH_AS_1065]|uniref:nucleotide sugar dehydrogenase n=1 Tax=Siphonobacter sp. SORGH_AS_1065 TaxID=3041795 RepID=UPI00277E2423|nr:nucleotide sugar dehydrogenase [Siphonobacter sp. SORGH_AS_1065]MDQ1087559.1 UDP-N-acetyl-D-galactosamine dehydrogenase [Siphonobacter sp. SORGH_AS_1065]